MKKVKQIKPEQIRRPADSYDVDGIRYIREDLLQSKMESIMERIAVAQETQATFYKKYDKFVEPLMKMCERQIKNLD